MSRPMTPLQQEEMQAENAQLRRRFEDLSVARTEQIETLMVNGSRLDLVFLVDCTSSMGKSIEMVRDRVLEVVQRLTSLHPNADVRIAFVGYRDYDDEPSVVVHDFMSVKAAPDAAVFKSQLVNVKAFGGDDSAEDVFSGLQAVASLSWQASGRLLVHIADAPCHGTKFHNPDDGSCTDSFPGGDKYGRDIGTLLAALKDGKRVTKYFFINIAGCHTMIEKFRQASGNDPNWLEEATISTVHLQLEKIVVVASQVIGTVMASSIAGTLHGYVRIPVREEQPVWSDASAFQVVTCDIYMVNNRESANYSLDEHLTFIHKGIPKMVLYQSKLKVKIANLPFSNEGSMRYPFYAQSNELRSDPRGSPVELEVKCGAIPTSFVVKRFKVALGKNVSDVHKRSRYVNQVHVQAVARAFAIEFNKVATYGVKHINFSSACLLEAVATPGGAPMFFGMERLLAGTFVKYSNNAGYVSTKDFEPTLQAFSHWTYHISKGAMMVTDLQGVFTGKVFQLSDPAVHCPSQILDFTQTNLGKKGCQQFFATHTCNSICHQLGLPATPEPSL